MKVYEVIVESIWNNLEQLGYYKNLDDAIQDINNSIFSERFKLKPGDLREYASTYGSCFDTRVRDIIASRDPDVEDLDDEDLDLQIRGFILDSEAIIKSMVELAEN